MNTLVSNHLLAISAVLPANGWIALAVIVCAIVLWFTEIVPPPVTAMAVVAALPLFHVLTFDEAAAGLGQEIIWLIVSMLIMGVAVEETALAKRMAFGMLAMTKGNMKVTILVVIIAAFFLTFFVPNGMGRLGVLLPISIGLVEFLQEQAGENIKKSIMLAVTFVPYVSTVSLLSGASGSIYAAGLFDTMLGFKWSYLHWMAVMLPGSMFILFCLWIVLLRLFPLRQTVVEASWQYFEQAKQELGPISAAEIKLLVLYAVLILLWITKDLHGIPIAMSAVIVSILLFIPGIRLLEWKSAMYKVDWGVPILFAAGFAIANGLEKGGVMYAVSGLATRFFEGKSPFWLTITLMLVFTVIRIGFTHFTAMIASVLPIALTFAKGSPYNPVWVGMICVVASSLAYLFPAQSISNMTTYSLGYYSSRDMLFAGSMLTVIVIVVTMLAAFYYWPLVGLIIYK